jgi:hypothetical protein
VNFDSFAGPITSGRTVDRLLQRGDEARALRHEPSLDVFVRDRALGETTRVSVTPMDAAATATASSRRSRRTGASSPSRASPRT